MLPELQTVLAYRNPLVLTYFRNNFPHLADQAERLFDEMLKFLWLTAKHEDDLQRQPNDERLQFFFVMHEEMRDIDNMWHAFILNSRPYSEFCQTFFGRYLHHEPNVMESFEQTPDEFAADLEKLLSYTYDELGAETVRFWFAPHLPAAA